MKTKIKIGKKIYNIEIIEIDRKTIKIMVDDKEFFFNKEKSEQKIEEKKIEEKVMGFGFSEKEIKNPIAGVISEIFVKEEDEISPGQKIATIIAMKMENEIISETQGKIKEIKIKKNQFVNSGETILILE